MALRVLLADESSTIKKVFQLALQDFAVEVRPVNIGLDVLPVAKNFQPDIIFADVLLQKKNGYEVCMDLKNDSGFKNVPVVLMWSGFMELDEDKFQASHANGRLEKPFDVSALRKLVTDLVPKTQTQRLSQFLSFPKMPEIEDPQAPPPARGEEDFERVSIQKMKSGADRFRIPIDAEEDPDMPVDLKLPSEPIDMETIFRDNDEPEEFTLRENKTAAPKPSANVSMGPPQPTAPPAKPAVREPTPATAKVNDADVERIIRAEAREIIEAVVWKVLPELAQQIIEREIQKLLKEKDATLYR